MGRESARGRGETEGREVARGSQDEDLDQDLGRSERRDEREVERGRIETGIEAETEVGREEKGPGVKKSTGGGKKEIEKIEGGEREKGKGKEKKKKEEQSGKRGTESWMSWRLKLKRKKSLEGM